MAEGGYDNVEMDGWTGDDYAADDVAETSFNLPDNPTLMLPELVDGRTLDDYGDRIGGLKGDLRTQELKAQRKRLVDSFYKAIERDYIGLRLTEKPEYGRFEVDENGKTLYWKVDNKTIQITTSRGPVGFLGLSTIARNYGVGGSQAIRDYLNLPEYSSKQKRGGFTPKTAAAFKKIAESADAAVKADDSDLGETIASLEQNIDDAYETVNANPDPPDDLEWDHSDLPEHLLPLRELKGLDSALKTLRGTRAVQESKKVALQQAIEGYREDLERAGITEEETDQIEHELQKAEDELAAVQESIDTLNLELRSQFRRIRETITRVLDKNKSLAERVRILFREQGVTIVSILTAIGMTISTLVLALTGGTTAAPPTPPPGDRGGVKEWVKKHLQSLGRLLGNLAGKAAAALPGIIGSVVSWLLTLLAKTTGWLAENLWAVVVAVGSLLLVAARGWLA